MVVEYADLECPYCAQAHLILKELPITRVFEPERKNILTQICLNLLNVAVQSFNRFFGTLSSRRLADRKSSHDKDEGA